jgi:hypothetical protein
VPEATSALLFGLVVALLWFALAHGREVETHAAGPRADSASVPSLGVDVPGVTPSDGASAAIGRP